MAPRRFDATLRFIGRIVRRLGYELRTPIFVVGTGRCGTNLLMRVLRSHSQLTGFPGEANDLWHPHSYEWLDRTIETPTIMEDPERFTQCSVASWPTRQPERIHNSFAGHHFVRGRHKAFFTKSSMISFMIPRILELFPDARLVHIYRNGPSVVDSFLKKGWNPRNDYLKDLPDARRHVARYWNRCLLEIDRQNHALGLTQRGALLEFSYEQLCAETNATLARLADFLGVTPAGFTFDLSQISSRNYKVGDYAQDPKWNGILDEMAPAMKLKGYLP